MSKFFDKCRGFFRKFTDLWLKAVSAELFIFMAACLLLFYTLFVPNFIIIMVLLLLFAWALLF